LHKAEYKSVVTSYNFEITLLHQYAVRNKGILLWKNEVEGSRSCVGVFLLCAPSALFGSFLGFFQGSQPCSSEPQGSLCL
jgi:hypothetical protein